MNHRDKEHNRGKFKSKLKPTTWNPMFNNDNKWLPLNLWFWFILADNTLLHFDIPRFQNFKWFHWKWSHRGWQHLVSHNLHTDNSISPEFLSQTNSSLVNYFYSLTGNSTELFFYLSRPSKWSKQFWNNPLEALAIWTTKKKIQEPQ